MDDRYDSAVECGRTWFEDQELYHHGTKGMKWGVRRYQHEDGSLTALGRIHYGVGKARDGIGAAIKSGVQKHKAKVAAKKEEKRIEALMKKPIRKLSEAELKERTARANQEKALRQIEDSNKQAAMSFMAKVGSKLLNDAAVPALVNAGRNVAQKFLEKALTRVTGLDAPDMTNTFDILKKAGGDVTKLTDKQRETLGKQKDVADKFKKNDEEDDLNTDDILNGTADLSKYSDKQIAKAAVRGKNIASIKTNRNTGDDQETSATETPKTETPKTETPKTETPKTETPKTEPSKTEPSKTEPSKTEPTKSNVPATTNTAPPAIANQNVSSPAVQSAESLGRTIFSTDDTIWAVRLGMRHTDIKEPITNGII